MCDSTFIQNNLLNVISKTLQADNQSSTNMLILNILSDVSKNLTTDIIASKVLPIMIPFLVNKSSSKAEFSSFIQTIKDFLTQIEKNRNMDFQNQPENMPMEEPEDEILTDDKIETMIEKTEIDTQLTNLLFGVERKNYGDGKIQQPNQSKSLDTNVNAGGYCNFTLPKTNNNDFGGLTNTTNNSDPMFWNGNTMGGNTMGGNSMGGNSMGGNTGFKPNTSLPSGGMNFDMPLTTPTMNSTNTGGIGSNLGAFDDMGLGGTTSQNTVQNNNLFGGMNMSKNKNQGQQQNTLTNNNLFDLKPALNPTIQPKKKSVLGPPPGGMGGGIAGDPFNFNLGPTTNQAKPMNTLTPQNDFGSLNKDFDFGNPPKLGLSPKNSNNDPFHGLDSNPIGGGIGMMGNNNNMAMGVDMNMGMGTGIGMSNSMTMGMGGGMGMSNNNMNMGMMNNNSMGMMNNNSGMGMMNNNSMGMGMMNDNSMGMGMMNNNNMGMGGGLTMGGNNMNQPRLSDDFGGFQSSDTNKKNSKPNNPAFDMDLF